MTHRIHLHVLRNCFTILVAAAAVLGADSEAGKVGGQLVMTRTQGDSAEPVPNARLQLTDEDGRHLSIKCDNNGTFAAELQDGVYCISEVRDEANRKLHPLEDQSHCFRVVSRQHTLFSFRVRGR